MRSALHGELRFEALAITKDARDCEHAAAIPVTQETITLLDAAVDLDGVPALGVADVADRDVVVLAPEERYVGERRAVTDEPTGDGLSVPLGQNPVLDPHEPAPTRIGPARRIADGEDASRGCFQRRVHDDALVDPESGLLGERDRGQHAHARDHEIGTETLTIVEDHGARRDAGGRMAEVKDNAVLLVQGTDEVAELLAEHTLERAPTGRHHVHRHLPRPEGRRDLEADKAGPKHDGSSGIS